MMGAYILEIDPPLAGRARYYIGWTSKEDPYGRLFYHQRGKGAKITAAAVMAGCTLSLVAWFPYETRAFERELKRKKNTPRFVQ